jgi:hypothetical protein
VSRANSGDADKYQLAAAVVRARSAQDDCLEMLLGEMSSLSREVRTLRAEVEALRLGGSGEPRLPDNYRVEQNEGDLPRHERRRGRGAPDDERARG